MKEQIQKWLVDSTVTVDDGYGGGRTVIIAEPDDILELAQELEQLVNQEVEKRIAETVAGKMVEHMRQKLFSMRSTKEAMDKLNADDKLRQYGYHDCINEILMWTKPLSHD